jgi:hypothetical protein
MIFMVSEKFRNPRFDADPGCAIGFDMSAMKEEVYGEAIIDTVKPETLVSDPVIIKVRESTKVSSHPPNENFLHVGHIRPRRSTASTQFPILFLPRLHLNETHKNSHLRVVL